MCAGIGRRLGLTPWISRLLFVLLLMVVPGSQLLIYPVLWILMPAEERRRTGPRHVVPDHLTGIGPDASTCRTSAIMRMRPARPRVHARGHTIALGRDR